MAVADWWDGWLAEHLAIHSRVGLPAPGEPGADAMYSAWRSEIIRRGIHEHALALQASQRLAAESVRHGSQHFARFVEVALVILRERTTGGADDQYTARMSSRDCEWCFGDGLAPVIMPEVIKGMTYRGVVPCWCDYGLWYQRAWDRPGERPVATLDDVIAGRTMWQYDRPEVDPEIAALASEARTVGEFLAALRARWTSWKTPGSSTRS